MDKLKVAFIDFWGHFPIENPFLPILQRHFEVEINETNPDVIFHTINGPNTKNYSCKKILFMPENFRANQYDSDYTLSFDPQTEKNYFFPAWQYYLHLHPEHHDLLFNNRVRHENFERFCSFIVTNGSNFMRKGIFDTLHAYKRVHSYGKFMTNDYSLQQLSKPGVSDDGKPISAGGFWRIEKMKFLNEHPHKFAITFENTATPYYCTEKIMDAFLVGSMPIYWGDPRVGEDWNEEAFVNIRCCFGRALEIIKELDNNNEKFLEKYSKPVFTAEQKERHIKNLNGFEPWLIDVIKK